MMWICCDLGQFLQQIVTSLNKPLAFKFPLDTPFKCHYVSLFSLKETTYFKNIQKYWFKNQPSLLAKNSTFCERSCCALFSSLFRVDEKYFMLLGFEPRKSILKVAQSSVETTWPYGPIVIKLRLKNWFIFRFSQFRTRSSQQPPDDRPNGQRQNVELHVTVGDVDGVADGADEDEGGGVDVTKLRDAHQARGHDQVAFESYNKQWHTLKNSMIVNDGVTTWKILLLPTVES